MALVDSLATVGQDALASEVGEGDFPLEVNFPQDYKRARRGHRPGTQAAIRLLVRHE